MSTATTGCRHSNACPRPPCVQGRALGRVYSGCGGQWERALRRSRRRSRGRSSWSRSQSGRTGAARVHSDLRTPRWTLGSHAQAGWGSADIGSPAPAAPRVAAGSSPDRGSGPWRSRSAASHRGMVAHLRSHRCRARFSQRLSAPCLQLSPQGGPHRHPPRYGRVTALRPPPESLSPASPHACPCFVWGIAGSRAGTGLRGGLAGSSSRRASAPPGSDSRSAAPLRLRRAGPPSQGRSRYRTAGHRKSAASSSTAKTVTRDPRSDRTGGCAPRTWLQSIRPSKRQDLYPARRAFLVGILHSRERQLVHAASSFTAHRSRSLSNLATAA